MVLVVNWYRYRIVVVVAGVDMEPMFGGAPS